MKKFIRWSAMLIIVVISALIMFSCDNTTKGSETSENLQSTQGTTATPTGTSPIIDDLIFANDGTVNVSIVYPNKSDARIIEAMKVLNDSIEKSCGSRLQALPDSMVSQSEDTLEILIGSTKYDVSSATLDTLEENSFSISVHGNKIVVVANHPYLYPIATQKLVEALDISGNKISLAGDFTFSSDIYPSVTLVDLQKTDYTIVYDDDDDSAYDLASKIQLAFLDIGAYIKVITESERSDGPEIIIGDTNRRLSAKDGSYYQNAWIGRDNNGNVAITGCLEYGTEVLIDYIKALGATEDKIILLDSMMGDFTPPGVSKAPLYKGGGDVEIIQNISYSNAFFITIHGASRSDYEDYTDILTDKGYTLHRSTEANGNIFETWTDGYTILTMSHIAYIDPDTQDKYNGASGIGFVRYMTISVDNIEYSALPICEPNIPKITTPQLSTLSSPKGNLAYVLRLEDGRFIIIDGGFKAHAASIYNTINDLNVRDGKPVIAAWFITHPHVDHVEGAREFLKNYASKVEIQAFIHHFPSEELLSTKGVSASTFTEFSTYWYEPIYDRLSAYFPDTKIILAHAGQHFEYGSIKIDVLFTSENLYQKKIRDTNSTSVAYSITGKSGRMIILGDQQEDGCALINAIYGNTLKCDFVQVAHHGYNGGDTEMYASMAAKYAIWPSSYEDIIARKAHYNPSYGRNFFDFRTVEYNIIPYKDGDHITLYEGMTKEELAKLDVGLTLPT